jgi:DNA-binding MarR family transcriptional regulator
MPSPEPPASGEDEISKTVTLTDKDVRDAARLLRLLLQTASSSNPIFSELEAAQLESTGDAPDRQQLISRAKVVLHSRRLRSRHFSKAIFGEPAWDILLVLYITDVFGGRQTIGRLADWIETPPTTVLRWVGYLEKEHLVERQSHPTDRRLVFIRLLERGREALDAYLSGLPGSAT